MSTPPRPHVPTPPLPRLHAITDERIARRNDLDAVARELARGGGPDLALHARGHFLSGREHYELAVRLSACPPARLFVNDRLDVALATGAAGVQLGTGSLEPADARRLNPAWWIGKSVHDLAEAEAARAGGADYLLVGPVYATASHPGREPLGLDAVKEIVALGLPVVAIGGMTPERVAEVRASGVYGVAAIRALWDASDPAETARAMLAGLEWDRE
ncbi:MAG: thiamine phosphate synthase [Gemmatimonadales bacterium]